MPHQQDIRLDAQGRPLQGGVNPILPTEHVPEQVGQSILPELLAAAIKSAPQQEAQINAPTAGAPMAQEGAPLPGLFESIKKPLTDVLLGAGFAAFAANPATAPIAALFALVGNDRLNQRLLLAEEGRDIRKEEREEKRARGARQEIFGQNVALAGVQQQLIGKREVAVGEILLPLKLQASGRLTFQQKKELADFNAALNQRTQERVFSFKQNAETEMKKIANLPEADFLKLMADNFLALSGFNNELNKAASPSFKLFADFNERIFNERTGIDAAAVQQLVDKLVKLVESGQLPAEDYEAAYERGLARLKEQQGGF